jgi:hypothetical protein
VDCSVRGLGALGMLGLSAARTCYLFMEAGGVVVVGREGEGRLEVRERRRARDLGVGAHEREG